jgi:predicted enzyme related to lactoylglutathione lyase
MANTIPLIVYPTRDVEKAKKFFNVYLGTEPYADGAYYVGYKLEDLEIGLDPNATAAVSYVDVDDIAGSLQALKDVGGEVVKEITDVSNGLLVAQVTLDGNVLGLRQHPKS